MFKPGRPVVIGGREHTVESAYDAGKAVRLKLSGIETRDEAAALRGAHLEVPAGSLPALPKGEYYHFQVIGLTVRDSEGRNLGRVAEVLSTLSNDVYVIRGPAGELLIPALDDIVLGVDVAAGVMTVELVPGLIA